MSWPTQFGASSDGDVAPSRKPARAAQPAIVRAAPWLLLLLLAAAYAPTWDAEFVVWDDDDHIYENRHIVAADGYAQAWRNWRDPAFYPITFTLWWLEWRLADGAPWLFQLDNVLLHAAGALLLGLLLRTLGLRAGLAWAIAGVWALHPQQVASVAWLTERKNLLYVAFYFASLLVYARAIDPQGRVAAKGILWALVLAFAALMSKATAVTLPVAVVLTHWVRGGIFDRRATLGLGTFFTLSVAVGLLHVSREEVTPLLPLSTRLLIAARASWFYVGKFLWPTDLVAVYPRWSLADAPLWGGAAFFGLGATAAIGARFARRIPPIAWWGVGLYAANIALVVGVIWFPFMGYSFVSDHLAYLAAAGLTLVFGLAVDGVLKASRAPAALATGLTAGLWLMLAALTWQQTDHWENTERLWTRTLEVNPQSRLAHKNLGVHLVERGESERARTHFETTLALDPNDTEALMNLGVLASERGDLEAALEIFRAMIARGAYLATASNNAGIATLRLGDAAEAVRYFDRALELDPDDAKTWLNRGVAQRELGNLDAAISDYEKALRLNPRETRAHYNLAAALARAGRSDDAAAHYEKVLKLDPSDSDAAYNLAVIRMQQQRDPEAADGFRRALGIDPGYAEAAFNLGLVHARNGRLEAAEEAVARAHALTPEDRDTTLLLSQIRIQTGDPAGAIEVLERRRAAHPDDAETTIRLAWIRATCTAPGCRDADAALELAREAITQHGAQPHLLDTLAAALAAQGRFEEASRAEEDARRATPDGTPAAAERERRRALYESGRPYAPPP